MMSYFELVLFNKLCQLDAGEGRTPEVKPLSTQDFQRIHGPPPWVLLSEVLQKIGLDFEIPGPSSYSSGHFTPVVRKRNSGELINLEHLSSGEKMLMALAVSTYASTTYDIRTRDKTRLILLDEIDAPLHPSMTRTLLSLIEETLINSLGCSVILATHSPTTVAIAPEESVHVMRPERPGVEKVSRERAVRLLTEELPTLSLDFSGRRQVFVESEYDARRYDKLYQLYKDRLDFSLSFIAAGSQTSQHSGGCDSVKLFVNNLRKNGNTTVWGLIDWDKKNHGSEHIHILAKGRRYAIENCLLDPLLVLALIFDANDHKTMMKIGLTGNESILDLLATDASERRQQLLDAIQRLVLEESEALQPATKVTYEGGHTHTIAQAYLHKQGHRLVERVTRAFPCLKRHMKNDKENGLLERALDVLQMSKGTRPTKGVMTSSSAPTRRPPTRRFDVSGSTRRLG